MTENSSVDPSELQAAPTSLVVRLARAIGMDRAVGYAVLSKAWQLLTGPVTQLLIVVYFTTATQGYYQTFLYLIGMQIFVELGLHVVIINVCSHEWAGLSFDGTQLTGSTKSLSRLSSLYRLFQWWYVIAAVVFFVVVGASGFAYLNESSHLHAGAESSLTFDWAAPWLTLVLLTALQLPLLPIAAMLEGCDQLRTINRVRLWQTIAGTFTVWLLVASGAELWTVVGAAAVRLAGDWWLTRVAYRSFVQALMRPDVQLPGDSNSLAWRTEVLPLQWRIAVQGMLLWCVNGLPGLIVFRWHGDEAVARLGMTWTILTALQSASLAWIETRRPQFGVLISERRYAQLDQLFFRMTQWSVGLMACAGLMFVLFVWWIGTRSEWLFDRLASRMLPVTPTVQFVIALVLLQFALCTNLYIRAHKRDPFLAASIVSSLAIAGLEILWGLKFGANGVAQAYLLGVACVQVPLWTVIWWTCRRRWHAN